MTNFILNIYSTLFEILLWGIVIGFTIGGVMFGAIGFADEAGLGLLAVVLGGIVTTITFIRGFGTTIIVDHGNGFYTVYSHVSNVEINDDSEVRGGDVIAYMGDSGSINGSQLHFEVWGEGKILDPEKWLQKK